ncbi:MAG TPA: DUF1653 domain-containing protein [Candidatus Moranbacteria bacterium]|nr:MAG: hypothetical protein UW87_C0015G0010 [Candidatus Moranbacteria bacterium GW2011_GWC2_45_10]KKT92692.1 MAG: hypothetical protein UW95_C0030G0007 [Parcubacteria group bacterium GW2011_GWC1_45_14]HAV11543.1 DUF1653 domain-containing protein [Candidatus Moranbacteria bacterium]
MKLGKYKHFKGGIVEVIAIAHHSETLEDIVVYKALYECRDFGKGSIWVRPKQMFLENVVIDGKETPRFTLINN